MTQPKKPQPKAPLTYNNIDFAAGYNHGLFEMEAYYKPIVEELVEALELVLEETGTECYCSENYECGRCKSKQTIAKYKELK